MKPRDTRKLALGLMGFGLLTWGAGEAVGVIRKKGDDTTSEVFVELPPAAQAAGFFVMGAVFAHLARWTIRDKPNPAPDVNVSVEVSGEEHP